MSVWYCIPSARPVEEAEPVLKQWRERGYKIALWRDPSKQDIQCDHQMLSSHRMHYANGYPGYAQAVNWLVSQVLYYPEAEWFVTGGDDVLPDPNHYAEEIAAECLGVRSGTFSVMQPTGDRWHEGVGGFSNAPIDRVCGSPWMGREFCRRINQGNGPLWPEYQHMFEDEELQAVALKYGVLWQRRDLIHKHMHWGRGATDNAIVNDPKIPKHLEKWNTAEHWREAKGIFERRKAAGFPGSEPLV